MKIGILGATGKAGSAVAKEARKRAHHVAALVRDEDRAKDMLGDVEVRVVDALTVTSHDIMGLDVVVDAFGTSPDQAEQHLTVTEKLVEAARELGQNAPRLIFILGAGSLTHEGDLFIEQLRQVPGSENWIAIPENQLKQLEYLRTVEDVEWVGVSPQAQFSDGSATEVVLGADEIITAADGESHTTTGTMALGILDEIEQPQHSKTRFTVSDA